MLGFEEIERLAYKNCMLPKDTKQSEQVCFLSMRHLYAHFRSGQIQALDAAKEKAIIRRAYEAAAREEADRLEQARRQQKQIQLAGSLFSDILKAVSPRADKGALFLMAAECIGNMTQDGGVFYDTCKRRLQMDEQLKL